MNIQFINPNERVDINGFIQQKNILTIIFKTPNHKMNNTSGFKIYKGTTVVYDGTSFTTKFNTLTEFDDAIMFSNDGTVETKENPAIMYYYKPSRTPEQTQKALTQGKTEKIAESKSKLLSFLEEHPINSSAHNGKIGSYSVTLEKQSLMLNKYITYQTEYTIDTNAKLMWNETGKEQEEWTQEEFLQLICEIKQYIDPLVAYQQHIETLINKCQTEDQLDDIIIDYEQFLN